MFPPTASELPEEFEKRSATCWADELQCPVLIIHSRGDESVSYEQAEKMAECLQNAGKEYQLITYDDKVHGLHSEDLELIMEWCNPEHF
ncbi:MAG: prolyl oligopeptidase family serine peptidase [Firmicutes bacterium]|nr:prolyl oligopeptidase family serine peptidase [Bacillota bacterium]